MILPLHEFNSQMSEFFDDELTLFPLPACKTIYPSGKSGPEWELRLTEDGPAIGELPNNHAIITLPKEVSIHLGYGNKELALIGDKQEITELWDAVQSIMASFEKVEIDTVKAKALLARQKPTHQEKVYPVLNFYLGFE